MYFIDHINRRTTFEDPRLLPQEPDEENEETEPRKENSPLRPNEDASTENVPSDVQQQVSHQQEPPSNAQQRKFDLQAVEPQLPYVDRSIHRREG